MEERRSDEQEKKLRSDAGEIEKKKGVTSSSSWVIDLFINTWLIRKRYPLFFCD